MQNLSIATVDYQRRHGFPPFQETKCRTQMSNKQIQRGYVTVFTMLTQRIHKGWPPQLLVYKLMEQ